MNAFNDLPSHVSSALALIKFNDGVFKSTKQANFLMKLFSNNNEFDPKFAGIEGDGKFFSWDGYVRWCDYGSNSVRPYGWVFEYDQSGIVRQWKLKWKGTMRQGTSVDPKGTKLIFTRSADADVSHLVEQKAAEAAEPPGEFLGEVGQKIEGEFEVTNKYPFESDWGGGNIIGFRTAEGNKAVWFATNYPKVEVGKKYKVRGSIKKLGDFRGMNQTTLTRCKILEEVA